MTTTPVIFNKAAITSRLQTLGWAVDPAVPGYALTDTLRRFQKAHFTPAGLPLDVDGDYGPQTEAALFSDYHPADVTFAQAFIVVLRSQLAVCEVPRASNSGPQVSIYLRSVGLGDGKPWCMSLQYWAAGQACRITGKVNPLPSTGGCIDMWVRCKSRVGVKRIAAIEARENPALVLPGMIAIWLIAPITQAGHTGAVAGRQKLLLETLEGNSNENGSRDGELVADQHKRMITDSILMGFLQLTPLPL